MWAFGSGHLRTFDVQIFESQTVSWVAVKQLELTYQNIVNSRVSV